MPTQIPGTAYIFARDDIDTDLIIPAKYLTTGDPLELAWHVLEPLRGDNALLAAGGKVDLLKGEQPKPETQQSAATGLIDATKYRQPIVVAGANFGCGSSREHAVWALTGAGVAAVIADSFARIFFRNSINFGLPVVVLPGATQKISAGDQIEIDYEKSIVRNLTAGKEYSFEPLPEFLAQIVLAGGLLNTL